jgi:hypothetical protein
MRLLLYRNCQVLSVFSLEPSIGGSHWYHVWDLEVLRSLWCLRVSKKNKCIRSSNDWPLFPRMLIFIMPSSAVKQWKWGPKYLERGNQMLRKGGSRHTTHSPLALKYFPRILRVRRKKFSHSTMPGGFKGTAFRKNLMGVFGTWLGW